MKCELLRFGATRRQSRGAIYKMVKYVSTNVIFFPHAYACVLQWTSLLTPNITALSVSISQAVLPSQDTDRL